MSTTLIKGDYKGLQRITTVNPTFVQANFVLGHLSASGVFKLSVTLSFKFCRGGSLCSNNWVKGKHLMNLEFFLFIVIETFRSFRCFLGFKLHLRIGVFWFLKKNELVVTNNQKTLAVIHKKWLLCRQDNYCLIVFVVYYIVMKWISEVGIWNSSFKVCMFSYIRLHGAVGRFTRWLLG